MRFLICLSIAIHCFALAARADENAAAPRETVVFDDQPLVFAFEGANPGETFKEYIPEGETLETWTKFASIRQYPAVDDPLKFAQFMAQAIKQNNSGAQCAIGENEQTGEVLIDFITWPDDHAFVEFNIFKFRKVETGGLVAEQYAERAYENETEFLKGLKELREKLVPLMAQEGLKVSPADTPSH